MKPEEIISIVEELNSDLFDICPKLCESGVGYTYTTSGYYDAVDFCGQSIYCSEWDSEDDIDDAGGFKEFLIQERDRFIDGLVKVKGNKSDERSMETLNQQKYKEEVTKTPESAKAFLNRIGANEIK